MEEQASRADQRVSEVADAVRDMRREVEAKNESVEMRLGGFEKWLHNLETKNREFEGLKQAQSLSVVDRNRLDELTDFYRHLNEVIESLIEKFSVMERTNKALTLKAQLTKNTPAAGTGILKISPVKALVPSTPIKILPASQVLPVVEENKPVEENDSELFVRRQKLTPKETLRVDATH